MAYTITLLLSLSCFFIFILHILIKRLIIEQNCRHMPNLPPGPKPLPLLGNILHLVATSRPHRTLTELAATHAAPLMLLKFGSIPTVVASSPETAKEVLKTHDSDLSARFVPNSVRALDHHQRSLVWLPVSPLWRTLRRIASTHLFSSQRLDSTQHLRRENLGRLIEYVKKCCERGCAVDVGGVAFTTALNLLSQTFFSIDHAGYGSGSGQEFRGLVWGLMAAVGSKASLVDLFPVLGFLGPIIGGRRIATSYIRRLFAVFDEIIRERLAGDTTSFEVHNGKNDVLQTLLQISRADDSELSVDDIKHLLLDLFVAGTDTTASTLEWAMAELIRNPSMMLKAQAEIDQLLDPTASTLLEEPDIANLPYLQAIVKETLRLHSSGPFLLPHKAEKDVQICGYIVPKNTQVLVNIWAIGRDPDAWPNPTLFDPDRFMGRTETYNQEFDFLPFGAGRRMCPGMLLGNRMVHLTLAALIRSFDWKLEGGLRAEDMDMNEKFGITLPKAEPLLAIPLARKPVVSNME